MEREMTKVYVDMDGVLCAYYQAFREQYDEDNNPWPQSVPGFFINLEPIKDAIWGFNKLVELGYDVYILTAPSVKNNHCWSEKAAWIEKHLGSECLEKLIITKQKGLLHKPFDMLIDDHSSGGGREVFAQAGDLYWFYNEDADWLKVIEYFSG
jgi:5'(3')-deoxyribonucleotidase